MDNKNHIQVNNSPANIGLAALSGGGAGTLLISLVQNLPADYSYKPLLIMLAPAASAVITSFWVWAIAEFNKRRRDKFVKKTVAELQDLLQKKIADPSVPQKQKKVYEKQLAILEEKNFQRSLRVIEE